MYVFEHKLRVRYAETDQMGYVYYGNYAAYYEVARTEMLRVTGITYKQLEEMGVMMPVVEMHTNYYHPARYDELIKIVITIKERPGVRIVFNYEIFDEAGKLLNTGMTQLVFVDMIKNRPCKPPEIFLQKLDSYYL